MNIKHILAMSAIMAIIGNAIAAAEKRPSVEDINKQIGHEEFAVNAKESDAAFKELKADAKLATDIEAEKGEVLQGLNDTISDLRESVTTAEDKLKTAVDENAQLQDKLKLAEDAAGSTETVNTVSTDEAPTTDVILKTSLYDKKMIKAGDKPVAVSDAALEDLTEGVHYEVAKA